MPDRLLREVEANSMALESRWKHDGVRITPGGELDHNTAQTPGMDRKAAINFARVGAQKLWTGTVDIHANAKTGAHRHGPVESVIYVVKGKARMRWGDKLEFVIEAGPGDFIFGEAVIVNPDIEPVEKAERHCEVARGGWMNRTGIAGGILV
jgi:uncharacterized RmlC-like cupin family protein